MAARRYELSLLLQKSEIFFSTQEEKFWTSKQPCNVPSNYINTNGMANHFTLIIFCHERHNLLCSHSKGDLFPCEDNMLLSCVRTKAHLVNLHYLSPLTSMHCC